MPSRTLAIVNKKGLHARAAAKLAKCAAGFDAQIEVERAGQRVSALSIMGLMMLAASPGTSIEVHTKGNQAAAALDAVAALVEDGFGEVD
jgi:phosphocarrier protein HPr